MTSVSELTARDLGAFHDAELSQVTMNRETKSLSFVFELDTKARRAIHFTGVYVYKVSEIYFQNVVSRLRLSALGTMSELEIRNILAWVLDRGERDWEKLVEDIQSGKYLLLYLDPSVGAEVAVVAEEMRIS